MEYLGFRVSEEEYKSDSKKIQVILQLVEPVTIKQMCSFIGMANFYSHYIPQLSNFLALLNNALKGKKKGKIIWTLDLKKAFMKAKEGIAKTTLLTLPDYNKLFDIYADAFKLVYGGVIMQENCPISYYSCKFTGPELKFAIIDKELLVVVQIL